MHRHALPLAALAILVSCMRNQERTTDEASPTPKSVTSTTAPGVAPSPVAPTPPVTAPPATAKVNMSDQLTWTVAKSGPELQLRYRYENTGTTVIHLNDGAIQQVKDHLWTPLKTQVVQITGADTALLTIGVPKGTGTFPMPGLYVAVAPGTTFEGSRDVDAPLQVADGQGGWKPLPKEITKLALAIELFEGEPPKWVDVKTASGTARFPERPPVRTVQADAKPLP